MSGKVTKHTTQRHQLAFPRALKALQSRTWIPANSSVEWP